MVLPDSPDGRAPAMGLFAAELAHAQAMRTKERKRRA
jgi:hypothetical protein